MWRYRGHPLLGLSRLPLPLSGPLFIGSRNARRHQRRFSLGFSGPWSLLRGERPAACSREASRSRPFRADRAATNSGQVHQSCFCRTFQRPFLVCRSVFFLLWTFYGLLFLSKTLIRGSALFIEELFGSVLVSIRTSGDRPSNLSNSQTFTPSGNTGATRPARLAYVLRQENNQKSKYCRLVIPVRWEISWGQAVLVVWCRWFELAGKRVQNRHQSQRGWPISDSIFQPPSHQVHIPSQFRGRSGTCFLLFERLFLACFGSFLLLLLPCFLHPEQQI